MISQRGRVFASPGNMLKFIRERIVRRAERPPARERSCEGVLDMACIELPVVEISVDRQWLAILSVCIWQHEKEHRAQPQQTNCNAIVIAIWSLVLLNPRNKVAYVKN